MSGHQKKKKKKEKKKKKGRRKEEREKTKKWSLLLRHLYVSQYLRANKKSTVQCRFDIISLFEQQVRVVV